ncbi:MAG TPA: serine kinase [Polyangia bacterium]|jgi:hypothetical protein
MKLRDVIERLALENLTPTLTGPLAAEVRAGYATDLLSDILAHAPAGALGVTIQAHLNVVAVALHAQLAAVVLAGGRRPEAAVVARAAEEGVVLLATAASAFDVCGRLYELGLRGTAT